MTRNITGTALEKIRRVLKQAKKKSCGGAPGMIIPLRYGLRTDRSFYPQNEMTRWDFVVQKMHANSVSFPLYLKEELVEGEIFFLLISWVWASRKTSRTLDSVPHFREDKFSRE